MLARRFAKKPTSATNTLLYEDAFCTEPIQCAIHLLQPMSTRIGRPPHTGGRCSGGSWSRGPGRRRGRNGTDHPWGSSTCTNGPKIFSVKSSYAASSLFPITGMEARIDSVASTCTPLISRHYYVMISRHHYIIPSTPEALGLLQ
jgi:hypothetical protein